MFSLKSVATSISLLIFSYAANATTITLTKDNVVALTGEVSESSINTLVIDIESKQANQIYLYINSPGGSVLAGQKFIDYLNTTDKDVICVAKVAISMAHHIFEACKTRLVQSDSILMQHNMTAGTDGKIESMKRFLSVLSSIEHDLNVQVSKRIDMPLNDFELIIKDEWWVYGNKAVTLNLADKEVQVKCASAAYTTSTLKTVTIHSLFGTATIKLKVYDCPLLDPEVQTDGSGERSSEFNQNILSEYYKYTNLGIYTPK
jgi:ATP-dependent Clp protease protease subunit